VLGAHPVRRKQDTVTADPCHCLAVTKFCGSDSETRVITVVKSCANVQWCAANGEQCSETVNSETEQKSGVLRDKRVAVHSCCAWL